MAFTRWIAAFLTLCIVCSLGVKSMAACVPQGPASDVDKMHPRMMTVNVRPVNADEEGANYWVSNAQKTLQNKLGQKLNTGVAKNAILFLGDGMSEPTIVASRIYKGQKENATGEETVLNMETFPYTGISKTYCVDRQVADSACSATAYLCGVKGNDATIGVTAAVLHNDCGAMNNENNRVDSIIRWAQEAGKGTGIVTTTRITHASPAGAYSHVANRDWENDHEITISGQNPDVCDDIAEQLVNGETGSNIKVIMGGGRLEFRPQEVADEEHLAGGHRRDGKDLISQWQQQKAEINASYAYVWNKEQLLNVDLDNTEYLLGLFETSHMNYFIEANPETEPTLSEMVSAAIKRLQREENGFILFVEGGRIDHAHHSGHPLRSLEETIQFDEAIKTAMELTNEEDTLLVVTSDHAHTISISGYPQRGNPILDIGGTSDVDGLPYTTLNYANGPGYKRPTSEGGRYDLSNDDTTDDGYTFPSVFPMTSETHGGDDVVIFARGPWSHLFTGVMEQNVIPHTMAYASCVGTGLTTCDSP